ncbi:MAG: Rne/Rng family ribonuclease [Hyphomicrobium sp.]|nr:Rne/Rng family ribonuclease [Hyphomicrobium sp.]
MSNNKMLIDATHPEETRVVVLRDGRVEEFDYESAARKLLRGNIYLAKVTRVEPSLQAAFVDYGGNRHGFLAFNEIHPDYYQIPMADRQALLEEEAAAEAAEEAAADAHAERMARRRQRPQGGQRREQAPGTGEQPVLGHDQHDEDHSPDDHNHDQDSVNHDDHLEDDHPDHQESLDDPRHTVLAHDAHGADDVISEDLPEPEVVGGFEPSHDHEEADPGDLEGDDLERDEQDDRTAAETDAPTAIGLVENETVEVVAATPAEPETVETGSEDALEELPSRPRRRPRSYKIQEVIKRRQVILVQVVKEERGNKGAALTTYLSLAGRYTVLMPNTARGGGISRKITNPQDRKRLKSIAAELDVPEGMGLIIRTAGAARTQQEIKRDYEYLLRLWESVRDLTLQSTAPSLVYEEGNLIKRSIRDLYNKDVEEVIVAGDVAHGEARDFMRMLMPSHAKNVLLHSSAEPLFNKYGIERQLNAMFSPFVTLKSGGYLVINQTEALVAIDVNSGKSTREFSIEETAYNTNLEAADEIARQLKLRDLAGLIVIDFIDMEEKRNNRSVERRLKDALRFDRARIQLGRISHFGLMEMSRQRLRTGVLEGSTTQCPHCQGTGIIRSTESVALAVLRGIEDALMAGHPSSLIATTTALVALYILNNKRKFITELEAHHGISISVQASDKLQGANFTIEKTQARIDAPARRNERTAVNMDWGFEGDDSGAAESLEDERPSASDGVRFVGEINDEEAEPDRPRTREGRGGRDEGRGEGREARDNGNGEDGGRGRRRRRRRGRRGGERSGRGEERADDRGEIRAMSNGPGFDDADEGDDFGSEAVGEAELIETAGEEAGFEGPGQAGEGGDRGGRRRRRGRRGGRRGRGRDRDQTGAAGARAEDTNGYPIRAHVTEDFVDDFAGPAGVDTNPEATDTTVAETRLPVYEAPARQTPTYSEPEVGAQPDAVVSAAPGRRVTEPTASEPKIERVVVTPDQATAAASETVSEQPVRKGWWQRRLGT